MEGQTLEMALEQILDQSRLTDVLNALAAICHGKAEHLRANWQDAGAGRAWDRAADRLAELATNPRIVEVSI
jgi:hypothetical protein